MGNQNKNLPARMKDLQGLLKDNFKSIQSVLPREMDSGRFCRMAINAVIKNPALAECNPQSFVMAVINAGEMGLELGLDEAALVPYKGIVKVIPQWQGMVKLARNTGEVETIFAKVVLKDEVFEYEDGFDVSVTHVGDDNADRDKNEKAFVKAYAGAKLTNGTRVLVVMNRKQVEARRNVSGAWKKPDSAWQSWPGKQWIKTAIKELCKSPQMPKSARLSHALSLDDLASVGKPQAPAFADMANVTVDVESVAGTSQGEGEIKQPTEKKPEPQKQEKPKKEATKSKEKLAKGAVTVASEPTEDKQAGLVEDCLALERELSSTAVQKAKQLLEIDEAADLAMESVAKLAQLKGFYQAAMND